MEYFWNEPEQQSKNNKPKLVFWDNFGWKGADKGKIAAGVRD